MLIEQGGADIVRTRKTLLVMAACLGLLAAACGDDDDSSSGATTTAASGATTTAAAGATTTAASDTTAAPDTTAAGGATTLPSRGDADLVLWLDETRATAPVFRAPFQSPIITTGRSWRSWCMGGLMLPVSLIHTISVPSRSDRC